MIRYTWIVLTAALVGCGGSGSGSESESITCEPARKKFASPTAAGAGFYRGYLEHSYEATTTREGIGVLSPSGRLMFFADNGLVTGFFSLLSPSSSNGTSTLDGSIRLWSSSTASDGLPLDGYLTSLGELSAHCFSCDYAWDITGPHRSYKFRAQYSVPNEDICLASVDASGSWAQVSGEETTTITIDANSNFTGSDSAGCVYSGALSDHRVEGGIMDINATVSNCSKAGQFIGVGSIIGTTNGTAYFILGAMWSDSRVIMFGLEK